MCFEVETTTYPIARKEHRCIWCGELILKGEKYTRQKGRFEGEWCDNPWHNDCWDGSMEDARREGETCLHFTPHENERYAKASKS